MAQFLKGTPKKFWQKPPLISTKSSTASAVAQAIGQASRLSVYVGIPASSARDRASQLEALAGKITSTSKRSQKRKTKLVQAAAENQVNNAQLLYIHTKGSPLRHIPARPVLEPAIAASGNKEPIAAELAAALKAAIEKNTTEAVRRMKRAGMAGQNAARGWFTDSRNNWPPNAPSTIRQKGSDRPLIDTGALRQAITYVLDVTSLKDIKKSENEHERKQREEHEVRKESSSEQRARPGEHPASEAPLGTAERPLPEVGVTGGVEEGASGIEGVVAGAVEAIGEGVTALGEGALGGLAALL